MWNDDYEEYLNSKLPTKQELEEEFEEMIDFRNFLRRTQKEGRIDPVNVIFYYIQQWNLKDWSQVRQQETEMHEDTAKALEYFEHQEWYEECIPLREILERFRNRPGVPPLDDFDL